MSTSCTFPKPVASAFRIAREVGFDGIEIMVATEQASRSADLLKAQIDKHQLPVLSIHAPVLFYTQFVWGTDPEQKLVRTAQLARDVGASTVVVHPPFRWQRGYAERFLDIVRRIQGETGIEMAVENMFPWKVSGRALRAYLPGTNPVEMDCDALTIDFSHAALSGDDALQMAIDAGDRLRHVHLCDGQAPAANEKVFDEHLLPGEGGQPVAETLQYLADINWQGHVVAEVKTGTAKYEAQRIEKLRRTLAFAREHLRLDVGADAEQRERSDPSAA
ncbi:sugar phosphate isomerase/epimerase family protein [Pseudoclavibacter endophyticus]|nr:sugar phosphate isomerase/epimerase [Pseudoclavibacter endophyticus]